MGARHLLVGLLVAIVIGVPVASAASRGAARPDSAKSITTTLETITASDGAKLACVLVEPGAAGTAPAGGWPGVIVFHGLGQNFQNMETPFMDPLATYGFAALACDARGTNGMSPTGGSQGQFGLDGPKEVADAHTLFNWFAARPEVSNTNIGAFGVSLGGGEVWNATVAGVPFKAIAPTITWTNLSTALNPGNVPKTGYLTLLAFDIPISRWDPALASVSSTLLSGTVNSTVLASQAARSSITKLHTITTPTLLIQGRHDFLFDIDQAINAYKSLAGPKRLYVGNLGHWPDSTTPPDATHLFTEVIGWFRHYLAGAPVTVPPGVELAHDPYNGSTNYTTLPATHQVSMSLPGSATITGSNSATRTVVHPTGLPFETFADTVLNSNVTVAYTGASNWTHLVATVSVVGASTPLTEGATRISGASGTATIPLMNEAMYVPAGKELTVKIGATSVDNPYGANLGPTWDSPAPNGAHITIGAATLKLSVLNVPVS